MNESSSRKECVSGVWMSACSSMYGWFIFCEAMLEMPSSVVFHKNIYFSLQNIVAYFIFLCNYIYGVFADNITLFALENDLFCHFVYDWPLACLRLSCVILFLNSILTIFYFTFFFIPYCLLISFFLKISLI